MAEWLFRSTLKNFKVLIINLQNFHVGYLVKDAPISKAQYEDNFCATGWLKVIPDSMHES